VNSLRLPTISPGESCRLIGALGHDAGHFAASRYALVNDIGLWGMSLLCNPIMWQHQHTYAHHSYTNEYDHDPDLHHFDLLLRVHRRVQQHSYYKNQRSWPYVFSAYAFVVFGTCIWIPLDVMKTGFLYGMVEYTDRHRPLRSFGMIVHMVAYVVIVIMVPFYTSSSWYKALFSVVVHISTSGFLFGIFSQINHLSENCLEADGNTRKASKRSDMLKNSWAASQVETSNNFAPNSHLWHILSNGLNLQIEHHLFPSLNHSHLFRIAPVVEQTCIEYGVNYKCFRSWSDVMKSTLMWLDQLAPDSEKVKAS
jgi:fatty acid desaturase